MPDTRTKREKLMAMAAQAASPREADVARRMLAAMDADASLEPESAPLSVDWSDGLTYEWGPNGITIRMTAPHGVQPGMIATMLRAERELRNRKQLD